MNNLDLSILKALISNKKCALDFVNECDDKLFTPELWITAQAIISYIKTYKEVPTLRILTEKLEKKKETKRIEQITKNWSQIENISNNIFEFKHDLECLKNRFAEKQILQIKEDLSKLELGGVDVKSSINKLQKTINEVNSLDGKKAYESKDLKEYLPTFVEKFKLKKENPEFDVGLKTGYSFFDFATNGLKPADFIIIAGESGFGKSLFLNNIGIQVWLQNNNLDNLTSFSDGRNIIYFSLEMPYEDCFNRVLSRLSKVPIRHIENPKFLLKQEFHDLKKALDFIKAYPYKFKIIDVVDVCANDIDLLIEECQAEYGLDFDAIFADYLGIMVPNNNKSEEQDWLKQSITSYELRAVARKRKKPVFTAAQLNAKPGKDPTENIGLGRLARSKAIATHATHVIQIENRTNEENYPDFLYHFIKNRKGPKGKGILFKDLACATLIDNKIEEDQYDNYFINQDDISEELEGLEL